MVHGTLDPDAAASAARGDAGAVKQLSDVLHAAIEGRGDGPYALVPEPAAVHMGKHVRVLDSGAVRKGFRKFTASFSRNVLTTSKYWMPANAIEGGVRATLVGHAHPATPW